MTTPRILVFSKYYTPGYAAGGSMRTIVNLVEHFGDEFAFYVVADDRVRSESQPYTGIETRKWQDVGKARVMYLAPQQRTLRTYVSLLRNTEHDAVFLNGLFSNVLVLLLRRLGLVPNRPWIVAPRGELGCGAIGVKPLKKRIFFLLSRVFNLARGVAWQATHEQERGDISRWFKSEEVLIAPDMPTPGRAMQDMSRKPKKVGSARFIFVSRIDPVKNLEFALRCLADLRGQVTFSIFGPIDDNGVWRRCQDLLTRMPSNVSVEYGGLVPHEEVLRLFAQSDAFLLPTKGENFGYAFLESLTAGCPLVISDQTLWRRLAEKEIGWDLPLSDPGRFTRTLQELVDMDDTAHQRFRDAASTYASQYIAESPAFSATRDLLQRISSRP